ncbi:hypothetical protein XPA_000233 [Xanthoria parietina]
MYGSHHVHYIGTQGFRSGWQSRYRLAVEVSTAHSARSKGFASVQTCWLPAQRDSGGGFPFRKATEYYTKAAARHATPPLPGRRSLPGCTSSNFLKIYDSPTQKLPNR